jgi:hypothetical protein
MRSRDEISLQTFNRLAEAVMHTPVRLRVFASPVRHRLPRLSPSVHVPMRWLNCDRATSESRAKAKERGKGNKNASAPAQNRRRRRLQRRRRQRRRGKSYTHALASPMLTSPPSSSPICLRQTTRSAVCSATSPSSSATG